ncbi:hypothetical protein PR048_006792 [Dryococelus australis]|uniref:Uncharacterized protein n=1 Tax=Dryococelus australis TaxID=614101 RepID=A0ABQ9IBX8_9NEOP|nr:hypothetical protein PR048_006792 [Dryococelus australis]
MRVIEVNMELRWNERTGETGDPRSSQAKEHTAMTEISGIVYSECNFMKIEEIHLNIRERSSVLVHAKAFRSCLEMDGNLMTRANYDGKAGRVENSPVILDAQVATLQGSLRLVSGRWSATSVAVLRCVMALPRGGGLLTRPCARDLPVRNGFSDLRLPCESTSPVTPPLINPSSTAHVPVSQTTGAEELTASNFSTRDLLLIAPASDCRRGAKLEVKHSSLTNDVVEWVGGGGGGMQKGSDADVRWDVLTENKGFLSLRLLLFDYSSTPACRSAFNPLTHPSDKVLPHPYPSATNTRLSTPSPKTISPGPLHGPGPGPGGTLGPPAPLVGAMSLDPPGNIHNLTTRIPTRRAGFRFPAGSPPDFRMRESWRAVPLVRGFSRGSPVYLALAFRRCSVPRFTLVGSRDLDVKCRPNLFTHSLTLFLTVLLATKMLEHRGPCAVRMCLLYRITTQPDITRYLQLYLFLIQASTISGARAGI